MTLQQPCHDSYMGTGASAIMSSGFGNMSSLSSYPLLSSHIVVGDSSSLPVTQSDNASIPLPTHPLHLQNILVTPRIINNLIFVRQFTTDNNCVVEFDPHGFFCEGSSFQERDSQVQSYGQPLHVLSTESPCPCLCHRQHHTVASSSWPP